MGIINNKINEKLNKLEDDGSDSFFDFKVKPLKFIWNHKKHFLIGSSAYACGRSITSYTKLLSGFKDKYPQYSEIIDKIMSHPGMVSIAGTILVALGLYKIAKLLNTYISSANNNLSNNGFDSNNEYSNIEYSISNKDAKGAIKNTWNALKNLAGTTSRISDKIIEKKVNKDDKNNINTSFDMV